MNRIIKLMLAAAAAAAAFVGVVPQGSSADGGGGFCPSGYGQHIKAQITGTDEEGLPVYSWTGSGLDRVEEPIAAAQGGLGFPSTLIHVTSIVGVGPDYGFTKFETVSGSQVDTYDILNTYPTGATANIRTQSAGAYYDVFRACVARVDND